MLEEERVVGPKGQVVIPSAVRRALKIHPGSKVLIGIENDKAVIKKQEVDAVRILNEIAKKGRSIKNLREHAYEEELEKRA